MPPEDKFLSQKLKKGGVENETVPSSPPFNIRTAATSANFSGPTCNDPPPWFQPDEFMYMSPGAYSGINPEQDEDETVLPATDPKTPDSKVAKPSSRPFISPVASTETTPLVVNTRPTVITPPAQHEHMPAKIERAPAAGDTIQSPGVPLLDGRPIDQVFPIGFVAELYGDSTARPLQEHPAAAELPGHEAPIRKLQVANSDREAPVELSSESLAVKGNPGSKPNHNQKTESSPFIFGANFASPPSKPRPSHIHKHSIQGQVPSQVEVPAASSATEAPGQGVSDGPPEKAESGTELESSLKPDGPTDKFGAQRVPSILQPARGRPKTLKSASDGQNPPSTTNRFVQKPLYDLPELDHQTAKPLHGHQSMILLNNKNTLDSPPTFTRTNTLPADLPSLPFMGNGFSTETEMSSPAPEPQNQQSPLPPAPSEDVPQMGSNFASTSRPHRGSLSDYANPVLPDIGQSAQPLSIGRKPSPTEVQGLGRPPLTVEDGVEKRAIALAEELSQAITEFTFYPEREPNHSIENVMSDKGGVATLWCQERMVLRSVPSELARNSSVPDDGSHNIPKSGDSGSGPPRSGKIPLDKPRCIYDPYRPPLGESPASFRRKPMAGSQGPYGISTSSNMGDEQQCDAVPPLDQLPQQISSEHYTLPPSHSQQPPSQSVEILPQPDTSSTCYPQTYSAEQQFVNTQSQARASTWPREEPTATFGIQNDDLASKPLPPVPQTMTQFRGLQSESSAPAVKEKRGLLSKFRRTGNTASSSNKLQKSVGNSPQSYSHVSHPPQQSPPQLSPTQFQGPSSPPNQTQLQGYHWPANSLDAWSVYGHDPRAFSPTIQLGGPQHEPHYVYQSHPMTPQQQSQYFQQPQQQQQVDSRRESEVSNLTSTSSPSPVPSNADTVSIADSSRVSIISSHHTRPGSDGAASLASVSTIGRNSEITPPPNLNRHNNGPGPSRWGSVSGYDGSGWGDVE